MVESKRDHVFVQLPTHDLSVSLNFTFQDYPQYLLMSHSSL